MVVNRMRLRKAAISVLLLLLRVGQFELKGVGRVLDVVLVATVPVGGRVGHQRARIVVEQIVVVGWVRRAGSPRDVHSLSGAASARLLLLLLKGCFGSGLVAEDGLEQGRCFLLAERSA